MRTPVLAMLLGLSLVACVGQIDGGGGDDDVPENCGNLAIDSEEGETCDDGNTVSGDGCSSTCMSEATPRVAPTVDKPTIATELGTSNMLTITLTSEGGFSGDVSLAASAVDGANAPVAGWIVAVNPAVVTVPVGGTATAVATLGLPSDSAILTGNIKVDLTSSLGTETVMSNVTALKQLTLTLDILDTGGGTFDCVYPVDATPISVRAGTLVRFYNKSTLTKFEIHSDNLTAFPHQGQAAGADDPMTEPNTAYERTIAAGGGVASWYCHDHGPDIEATNPRFTVVP